MMQHFSPLEQTQTYTLFLQLLNVYLQHLQHVLSHGDILHRRGDLEFNGHGKREAGQQIVAGIIGKLHGPECSNPVTLTSN